MNGEKGLKELGGEALVNRVLRTIGDMVDEVILVVGSPEQREAYSRIVMHDITFTIDVYKDGSPLVGALTGFRSVSGEYALITACDMPFISRMAVETLFDEAQGHNGASYQWPNEWIEPLFAVYRVEPSLTKAVELYNSGDLRLRKILLQLPDVKMIPIDALRAVDPDLRTLFDADTEEALNEAEKILKKM